ncbi:hypothetical protein [Streptomyces hainanensis]|uniref:Lipase family protein n=1 Tax=Streptomyces hainanensis TaxID=402648 RepID=A0A4R4T2P2_9ACTN|nr:hypothetical protein [Streptomyces hainanensis]TDC68713.1 hypothetical protein E1283_26985 [Streptomyces hainanensis]
MNAQENTPTPVPDEPALELLVHGVGGTTPQAMLEDTRTTRVTGDATACVHRRTDDLDDRPWDDQRPLREAYSWSNLTSGNGTRALWLLLLPFMIVNLAHWMRPAARGTRRTQYGFDVLVRLLALTLTVLFTAGACAVALDLIAWQCAGSAACAAESGWIDSLTGSGWWAQPGRRLALGAALPLALILLLWWLSHRTWSAYESASPPVRPRPDDDEPALLSRAGFWYGRGIVARLRSGHTAVGLLTITAALLTATGPHDRGAQGSGALAAVGWVLAALTAAGWLVVLVQLVRHGRTEEERDDAPEPPLARALPWGALALLLAVLAHTAWSRPEWLTSGRHPAGAGIFPGLMIAQGVLVVALALAAHRLHRQAPSADRGALFGLGAAAVGLLACGLGGVLTGGMTEWVADALDGSAGDPPEATIAGPPVILSWQAAAIPAWLLVVLGLAVAALFRVVARRRELEPGVRDRYPDEPCEPQEDRSRRIASAVARAELTDVAPRAIGWITGSCLALGLVCVAGAFTGDPPSRAAESAPAAVSAVADAFQTAGSWLMGAGVVLLVALGRRAYRDAGARRTIGILWDVGTFWPRAAHPFAPPCYAERAVPDLSWRMGTWIDSTGGRLVISGHSQGSVLAAAAVWQLDAATRSRIALLTHGSPIERLYGRWFPVYFGPAALRALHHDVSCWRNLWRATDPIGGPVGVAGAGAPPVDRGPLADPLHYGRNLARPLPEPILGHGDYAADPAFSAERADLFDRLVRGRPAALPGQQSAGTLAGSEP